MKLVHPLLSSPIQFPENCVPVLVIENSVIFRKVVTELVRQSEGEDGSFVFSVNDRCMDCSDHINVFHDYIHLQEIDKKFRQRLWQPC